MLDGTVCSQVGRGGPRESVTDCPCGWPPCVCNKEGCAKIRVALLLQFPTKDLGELTCYRERACESDWANGSIRTFSVLVNRVIDKFDITRTAHTPASVAL